jgi:hypothetical protein
LIVDTSTVMRCPPEGLGSTSSIQPRTSTDPAWRLSTGAAIQSVRSLATAKPAAAALKAPPTSMAGTP